MVFLPGLFLGRGGIFGVRELAERGVGDFEELTAALALIPSET